MSLQRNFNAHAQEPSLDQSRHPQGSEPAIDQAQLEERSEARVVMLQLAATLNPEVLAGRMPSNIVSSILSRWQRHEEREKEKRNEEFYRLARWLDEQVRQLDDVIADARSRKAKAEEELELLNRELNGVAERIEHADELLDDPTASREQMMAHLQDCGTSASFEDHSIDQLRRLIEEQKRKDQLSATELAEQRQHQLEIIATQDRTIQDATQHKEHLLDQSAKLKAETLSTADVEAQRDELQAATAAIVDQSRLESVRMAAREERQNGTLQASDALAATSSADMEVNTLASEQALQGDLDAFSKLSPRL